MSVKSYNSPHGKAWRVRVSKGPRGARIEVSRVVFGTKAEAKEVEAELRLSLVGLHRPVLSFPSLETPPTVAPSLEVVAARYLRYAKKATRSGGTIEGHLKHALRILGPKTKTAEIGKADIVSFVMKRRNEKNRQGDLISPGTVDRELTTIKAMFNLAKAEDLLRINPADGVPLARLDDSRDRVLSNDEFLKVLAVLHPFHRLIWLIARFTGLRRHHVLDLRFDQFKGGIIRPEGWHPEQNFRRSSKVFGTPPYPKSLLPILRTAKPPRGGGTPEEKRPLVFPWKDKAMKSLQTVFENSRHRSGADYWFHDLRRTFATDLRNKGVPLEVRTSILGHAPDPRYKSHMIYQVVTEAEIRKVGKLVFDDPFFKECLELAKS